MPAALLGFPPDASGAANDDWSSLLARQLREGSVADSEFDKLYPSSVRAVSSSFWTPVAVAIRAAELLVQGGSRRVLDVGSGPGKFAIVGASATGATFVGIEHRAHLVDTARSAARRLGLERAHFYHGEFDTLDPARFDGVYFFNPFEENLWGPGSHLDRTVEVSTARFDADVARAERWLDGARQGTRVVTYHGFGGEMPPTYHCILRERRHSGHLELWVKSDLPRHVVRLRRRADE